MSHCAMNVVRLSTTPGMQDKDPPRFCQCHANNTAQVSF